MYTYYCCVSHIRLTRISAISHTYQHLETRYSLKKKNKKLSNAAPLPKVFALKTFVTFLYY